jgi:hypothetical protein
MRIISVRVLSGEWDVFRLDDYAFQSDIHITVRHSGLVFSISGSDFEAEVEIDELPVVVPVSIYFELRKNKIPCAHTVAYYEDVIFSFEDCIYKYVFERIQGGRIPQSVIDSIKGRALLECDVAPLLGTIKEYNKK